MYHERIQRWEAEGLDSRMENHKARVSFTENNISRRQNASDTLKVLLELPFISVYMVCPKTPTYLSAFRDWV